MVDQVALATQGGIALRVLQWLHAWSAWLLKGPAALLQMMMLLLVGFGAAAFLPEEQQPFVLELGVGIAALVLVAFAPVVWLRADATRGTRARGVAVAHRVASSARASPSQPRCGPTTSSTSTSTPRQRSRW